MEWVELVPLENSDTPEPAPLRFHVKVLNGSVNAKIAPFALGRTSRAGAAMQGPATAFVGNKLSGAIAIVDARSMGIVAKTTKNSV